MLWLHSRRRPVARIPVGERLYAIGDIHGEAVLFAQLLERILVDNARRDIAQTTLIVLGDIIDRGEGAADLLLLFARLRSAGVVLLKGNHEATLVDCYRGDEEAVDFWLQFGGRSTLVGLGIAQDIINAADKTVLIRELRARLPAYIVDWIYNLPGSWSSGDYLFVHAGIRPLIPLDLQDPDDLLWIRHPFLSSRHDHGKVVVHGHTVEKGFPRLGGNRIGLDTGAHEHGRLTALALEGPNQWLLHAEAEGVDRFDVKRTAALAHRLTDEQFCNQTELLTRIEYLMSAIVADRDQAGTEEVPSAPPYPGDRAMATLVGRERALWADARRATPLIFVTAMCLAGILLFPSSTVTMGPSRQILAMPAPHFSETLLRSPSGRAAKPSFARPGLSKRSASQGSKRHSEPTPVRAPVSGDLATHRAVSAAKSSTDAAMAASDHSVAKASQLTGEALAKALADDRVATRHLNKTELDRLADEARN